MELTQENMNKLIAEKKALEAKVGETETSLSKMQESIAALEGNARKLKDEKAAAKQAADEAALEANRKNGDVEALEKSWADKLANAQSESGQTIESLQGMIGNMTAGAEAMKLATALAVEGQAEGLLPHIKSRLTTEIKDGQASVRVLDQRGKPSALSIDDLRTEIAETPYLAAIISGSKANGAGQPGGNKGGNGKTMKRDAFDALPLGKQGMFMKDGGQLVD